MLDAVLRIYDYNLQQLRKLVQDIPDDQMCSFAGPLVNHPAWVLGHLCQTADLAGVLLGLEPTLPDGWAERYGRGSTPAEDPSRYESKTELLDRLQTLHERVAGALRDRDAASLDVPTPHERLKTRFPTLAEALVFILIGHESIHLGQLTAWRRAKGLPSAS